MSLSYSGPMARTRRSANPTGQGNSTNQANPLNDEVNSQDVQGDNVNQANVTTGNVQGEQRHQQNLIQVLQTLTNVVQQQQQFQQQFSRGTPSRPHSELSEFKRLNPATFNGIGGPIKAEDWI